MFPSQMVRLKIFEPSSGLFCACFTRKWYALKLSNPQVVHFVHVSLANGTPQNCRTLKWLIWIICKMRLSFQLQSDIIVESIAINQRD